MKKDFIHVVYYTHQVDGFGKDRFINLMSDSKVLSKTELETGIKQDLIKEGFSEVIEARRKYQIKGLATLENK